MNKESILFGIIGLLLGLIIGFVFANSVNQSAVTNISSTDINQNSATFPPGHPEVTGQQTAAMPEIQAAIDKAKNEPESFEAQMKAAELYYQINRYDEAIEFLKKANEIKPDDYGTIVNLGNACFDSNKFEEAEKWYSTALTKKPEDVNVRTDLGLTFMFRSSPDYDRAVEEFLRSLEKDPNHVQTLQNLTVAYTKKGNAAKANETLSKLESLDTNNSAIPTLREEIKKIEAKTS